MKKTLIILAFAAQCIHIPTTITENTEVTFTEVDGYRFHTETYGSPKNPPLVIVHGGPGADFTYLRNLQELSDHYHVLFYDQRGTGLSQRADPASHSVDLFIEDLNALISLHSKGRKVRVIGHSWGGMLALAWAGKYPDKASHIVAAEPGALTPEAWNALSEKMKEMQGISMVLKVIPIAIQSLFVKNTDGHGTSDFIMTNILRANTNGSPYLCKHESIADDVLITRAGYESFDRLVSPYLEGDADWNYDFIKPLKNTGTKILMLSGSCSFIGSEWQNKYHKPGMPGTTRYVTIENSGHYMFNTKPQTSIQIVRDFLKQE